VLVALLGDGSWARKVPAGRRWTGERSYGTAQTQANAGSPGGRKDEKAKLLDKAAGQDTTRRAGVGIHNKPKLGCHLKP
jgi:hypothetical protein